MDRVEILARLGGLIADSSGSEVDWATVTEETSLDAFGVDSLAALDLIFELEDAFGIQVEPKEMLALKKAGDLVSLIQERSA